MDNPLFINRQQKINFLRTLHVHHLRIIINGVRGFYATNSAMAEILQHEIYFEQHHTCNKGIHYASAKTIGGDKYYSPRQVDISLKNLKALGLLTWEKFKALNSPDALQAAPTRHFIVKFDEIFDAALLYLNAETLGTRGFDACWAPLTTLPFKTVSVSDHTGSAYSTGDDYSSKPAEAIPDQTPTNICLKSSFDSKKTHIPSDTMKITAQNITYTDAIQTIRDAGLDPDNPLIRWEFHKFTYNSKRPGYFYRLRYELSAWLVKIRNWFNKFKAYRDDNEKAEAAARSVAKAAELEAVEKETAARTRTHENSKPRRNTRKQAVRPDTASQGIVATELDEYELAAAAMAKRPSFSESYALRTVKNFVRINTEKYKHGRKRIEFWTALFLDKFLPLQRPPEHSCDAPVSTPQRWSNSYRDCTGGRIPEEKPVQREPTSEEWAAEMARKAAESAAARKREQERIDSKRRGITRTAAPEQGAARREQPANRSATQRTPTTSGHIGGGYLGKISKKFRSSRISDIEKNPVGPVAPGLTSGKP